MTRTARTALALATTTTAILCVAAPPVLQDEDLHRPPARPLDARIEADKITEQAVPPLPDLVLLPLPPDHLLAATADEVPIDAETWARAITALERGAAFLLGAQHESGGWMVDATATPTTTPTGAPGASPNTPAPVSTAVTALALKALVQGRPHIEPGDAVGRAVRFIDTARSSDGSYAGGAMTNYVTSAVVSALVSTGQFEFHDELRNATKWLQTSQWDQGEGLDPRQDWFGGAGYGNRGRPDLSNTQMMLEAMYDAGMSPDEPAFQRALAFVTRAQNLKSTNDASWAQNDGGFIYTPANGGESMASQVAGEGRYGELMPTESRSLRSYGSMTYAGFKSLLYAGLSPNDERIRAAFDWVRRHWTFDENPGLGQQGLYYYYHAMSRAMRIAQQDHVTDYDGTVHNWREELVAAIVKRQGDDGSWVNDADRWLEGEPVMATVYAMLALEEAMKPVSRLDE